MRTLKISVLYGSVRTNRKGIRAALFIQERLKQKGHHVALIDPMLTPLPFLDKMYKEYPAGQAPENMEEIASRLKASDGFVIVTAEYNHSIPPALKNLLDHFQQEYFFKPSGIVSYSAGRFGGVRSAIQLRITLGELGTPAIPTIFSIPQVHKSIDEDGNPLEEYLEKQSSKFISELEWYAEAMAKQREQGTPY